MKDITAQLATLLTAITNNTSTEEQRVAARHYVELAVESITPDDIADDDLELSRFSCMPELYAIIPKKTLAERKAAVAGNRKQATLFGIIGNEALPLVLRREAAARAQRLFRALASTSIDDLVERYTPHPHLARLKELEAFIDDRSPVEDIDSYLKAKRDVIAEFRLLRGQYPKRSEGTPVLINPEQTIAYRVKENDPKSGVTRDTYSYALRQLGFNI
jgi:hypothetical protein